MKVVRVVCMLGSLVAALGCADTHGSSDQSDGCSDGAACTCPDGRKGQQVCDLDTHASVMCECPDRSRITPTNSAEDAGPEHEDAGVRPTAGHTAPAPAGGAAEGGRGGSAGVEPSSDAGAPHPGKGQPKKPHKGAGGEDGQA